MLKYFLSFIIFFFMMSSSLFAKTIQLFDQPQAKGNIIGTIDTSNGVIPIYTSSDKKWIKVGDPNNGNVGWVKSEELNNSTSSVTILQQMINTNNKPEAYIVNFGSPIQKLSPEESAALFKKMEERQLQFQKEMQQMINNMFSPIFMPGIVIPTPAPAGKNKMITPETKKNH